MKKQSFLIMAGALLAFASCKNENTEGAFNQAQVDSMVNARVEDMRVEMMRQNDSIINVMASQRADSIINAMKGGNATTMSTVKHTKDTRSNATKTLDDRASGSNKTRQDNAKTVLDARGGNKAAEKKIKDEAAKELDSRK